MNAWSNPDLIAMQEARTMALFLEARGHAPDQQNVYTEVVSALDLPAGARVLDLGCGTGIIARRLAQQVGTTGLVVGVDLSNAMLDVAQQHANHSALHFERGDATALIYEDAHFDHALAARLLMHTHDPSLVLGELRRVVRVGGRLALLERDWGTFAVDHSDRALTRRILDWRCDNIDGNNWTGRQLARLCMESGWVVRDIRVIVTVARDAEATLLGSLRHAAQLAMQHNIISQAEHDSWIGEIEQRLNSRIFFATLNEYIVIAERQ